MEENDADLRNRFQHSKNKDCSGEQQFSILAKLKHNGKQHQASIDRELNLEQISRVVGVEAKNLTVIYKGAKIHQGFNLPTEKKVNLLVIGSDNVNTEGLDTPDDGLPWWLHSLLPIGLLNIIKGILRILKRFIWGEDVVAEETARGIVAKKDEEFKLEISFKPERGTEINVEWIVDECGTLLLPAEQRFSGEGPFKCIQTLLSNGSSGVVSCVISEPGAKSDTRVFYFREP
eukprot:m.24926 g.24926  ORF g.24926 m.24926 type:complete len:232 (-) comp7657_c0_seq1:1230-1925(-)